MLTIHKYPLEVQPMQIVMMPDGATILSVQEQRLRPVMWALVDTDEPETGHNIQMYGTGHDASGMLHCTRHIGTVQIGGYVWHYFY